MPHHIGVLRKKSEDIIQKINELKSDTLPIKEYAFIVSFCRECRRTVHKLTYNFISITFFDRQTIKTCQVMSCIQHTGAYTFCYAQKSIRIHKYRQPQIKTISRAYGHKLPFQSIIRKSLIYCNASYILLPNQINPQTLRRATKMTALQYNQQANIYEDGLLMNYV